MIKTRKVSTIKTRKEGTVKTRKVQLERGKELRENRKVPHPFVMARKQLLGKHTL